MKSFEEEFPSLKDNAECTLLGNFKSFTVVPVNFIQEHCLDKQRIKEALNKHVIRAWAGSTTATREAKQQNRLIQKIKEELGLLY